MGCNIDAPSLTIDLPIIEGLTLSLWCIGWPWETDPDLGEDICWGELVVVP